MDKVQFRALPGPVKIAVWASFIFLWVAFEKLVIEPFGIFHYMPFYRVEGFCPWDALAIVTITVMLVRLNSGAPAD